MKKKHLLIIDDDNQILSLLSEYLRINDFLVDMAINADDAKLLLEIFSFDLIISDVMMPGSSGIDFLKSDLIKLNIPIILLTALVNVDDRINGLESGAEDYISKPFEPKELLIRINKLLSRFSKTQANIIKFGKFSFDMEKKMLIDDFDNIKHITTTERDLLNIFLNNSNKIITREEIISELSEVNLRTIDTQIARLRIKIEEDPKYPKYLHTIRNKGYKFVPYSKI